MISSLLVSVEKIYDIEWECQVCGKVVGDKLINCTKAKCGLCGKIVEFEEFDLESF
jgi:hypothetical protein